MRRGEMGAWEEDDGDDGGALREGNEWREEGWRAMVLEMGSLGSASRSGRGSAYPSLLDGLGCFKIF